VYYTNKKENRNRKSIVSTKKLKNNNKFTSLHSKKKKNLLTLTTNSNIHVVGGRGKRDGRHMSTYSKV